MWSRSTFHLALMLLPATTLASVSPAHAEDEIALFAVGKYAKENGSAYCCATCKDLDQPETDADQFLDGFNFLIHWWQVEWSTDLSVEAHDFTDPSQYLYGLDYDDPDGTDFADVIFYSGHGLWEASDFHSRIIMGESHPGGVFEHCGTRIADDTPGVRHMEFGNGGSGHEASAFVAFACSTTQHEVWEAGGYNFLSHPNGQFNILNGFHGIVSEYDAYQLDLRNYSEDAGYAAIGDAWIDRMFHEDGSSDNCPIPMIWGESASATDYFYSAAGWEDFIDTGARSGTLPRIYYICGCNPADGEALTC